VTDRMTDAAGLPPPDARPAAGGRRFIRRHELVTILLIVVFDQITKQIVDGSLALYESVTVIPGLLDFTYVRNTGAAFGLLNAADFPGKSVVMIGIAALALLAIAAYGAQLGWHERLARFGLALILGGAIGNLIDRALRGYVIDFVDMYWGTWHFWAFNVADAAITVGAALVILDMFGIGRHHASHPV
jgi:signal peptidase II